MKIFLNQIYFTLQFFDVLQQWVLKMQKGPIGAPAPWFGFFVGLILFLLVGL